MLRPMLFAAAIVLGACATQTASSEPPAARDCFNGSTVRGFNMLDNHHVNIQVGASRNYILSTEWNANDLNWTQSVALRSATGFICTGNGLGVEIIGGRDHQRYPINSIERAPAPQHGS